jgi:hypothetical protein
MPVVINTQNQVLEIHHGNSVSVIANHNILEIDFDRKTVSVPQYNNMISIASDAGPQGPPGTLFVESRTDDPPSPVVGQIWLRTDL